MAKAQVKAQEVAVLIHTITDAVNLELTHEAGRDTLDHIRNQAANKSLVAARVARLFGARNQHLGTFQLNIDERRNLAGQLTLGALHTHPVPVDLNIDRSEERRVGKEWRSQRPT